MNTAEVENDGAARVLRIEGEMTIYRAAELKRALVEAASASAACEVDLSEVSEIDSAGIQLMLLAKQIAGARQADLQFFPLSDAVTDVLDLLNLTPYFAAHTVQSA